MPFERTAGGRGEKLRGPQRSLGDVGNILSPAVLTHRKRSGSRRRDRVKGLSKHHAGRESDRGGTLTLNYGKNGAEKDNRKMGGGVNGLEVG